MSEWHWLFIAAVIALVTVLWVRRPAVQQATERRPNTKAPPKKEPKETDKPAEPATLTTATPERKAEQPITRHPAPSIPPSQANLPTLEYEEDDEIDPTKVGAAAAARAPKLQPPTKRIVYDDDALVEEPTRSHALILVTAQAQTDKGLRRQRNEDSILAMPDEGVFVVADGMGGYQGGEIASALAVKRIEHAFRTKQFDAEPHESLPPRASELARAIQMANDSILERASADKALAGMGTTICAVRFVPQKQRMYVGHVGDSRLYRVREGELRRMTQDHTMKDLGVTGPQAAHLSRAVGVWPTVAIDVVLGTPSPGDLYILCSDGLTKMVSDDEIARIAGASQTPIQIVEDLVATANKNGGKDNISVIVIRVVSATGGDT